jgi:hypothetical protein
MIMLKNFLIIFVLITTSACTTTTFVRTAPNYRDFLTKDKVILLLPPTIEVNQVDISGKKTRMYNYEDQLENHAVDVFIDTIQPMYNVKLLSKADIANYKLSHIFADTKDAFDDSLDILYKDGAWKEEKAHSIDQKIPAAINFHKKIKADVVIIMNIYAQTKTSGALLKDLAINMFAKNHLSEFTMVRLGIIDLETGRLLWAHSVSESQDWLGTTIESLSNNTQFVDKTTMRLLFLSALKDLP